MISRLLSNSRGFGYIQVLLTSSAIAGLALFGMKLSKEHEGVVDQFYRKKLTYYVSQEINHLLRSEKNCSASLKGYSAENSYVTHLVKINSESNGLRSNTFYIDQDFFEKQVVIKNIKIFGKREDARLEQGLTFLEIDFSMLGSDNIIKRSIPIYFKEGTDGNVFTCFSKGQSVFATEDKYWKSVNGNTHAALAQDELNPVQNLKTSSAAWNNNGAISFQVKKISELENCNESVEGVITFTDIYGPTICKNNSWRRLGSRQASWHLRNDFQVTLNKAGSKELIIKDYKSCFITEMNKKNLSEGCLLKEVDSSFVLTAFSSEYISSLLCKVSCVK